MNKLTKRQNDILDVIKRLMAKKGFPPTVREIAEEINLSSPATIHFHLTKLEEKGFIKRDGSKNRAIELLVTNEYIVNEDSTVAVPHLGKISAGNPIEAIELPSEFYMLPPNLIPARSEVFTLLVKGDSMINEGIYDGDIVIIKKQITAHNGEIVAAMTDENEVTLKTYYQEKDHFRLQPQNDTMSPIILDKVTILGKAIGLYREI